MEEIKWTAKIIIYIDEAGDEGLNKGSKYFILTAIIVPKNKDLEISKEVDCIKNNLEIDIKNNYIGIL